MHGPIDVANDAALLAGGTYLADMYDGGSPAQVIEVVIQQPEKPTPVLINAADGASFSAEWDSFIGQEKVKAQLRIYIAAAKAEDRALEHTLFASGFPGVGKTTLSRLVAKELGVHMIMLVPPFSLATLHEAAKSMPRKGVLFIDEIHKLADIGAKGPECLLHLLEEKRLYTDEGMVQLRDITVIGATTEPDKLPETILTRFELRPHFERYDEIDMTEIVATMSVEMDANLPVETVIAIANASHGIPRRARSMVKAGRAITTATGASPTGKELLDFQEIDPDGLEAIHRDYLSAMFQYFGRRNRRGGYEYVAGEMSMATLLRETKQGIGRIERFLIENGLLDRTPSGRRLTPAGIARAQKILTN